MKHYTETVPFELAIKLKEANFPQSGLGEFYRKNGEIADIFEPATYCVYAPLYAEVLDWLLDKGFGKAATPFGYALLISTFFNPTAALNLLVEKCLRCITEKQ